MDENSSKKRSIDEPTSTNAESTDAESPNAPASEKPVDPAGLKPFIKALTTTGPERTLFVKTVPAGTFYKCRALHLHHKHGPITDALARKNKTNDHVRSNWDAIKDKPQPDAYAQLLIELQRDLNCVPDVRKDKWGGDDTFGDRAFEP
ncbi:hypothetical protein ACROYT_G003928 [Oculina patagonica]